MEPNNLNKGEKDKNNEINSSNKWYKFNISVFKLSINRVNDIVQAQRFSVHQKAF